MTSSTSSKPPSDPLKGHHQKRQFIEAKIETLQNEQQPIQQDLLTFFGRLLTFHHVWFMDFYTVLGALDESLKRLHQERDHQERWKKQGKSVYAKLLQR